MTVLYCLGPEKPRDLANSRASLVPAQRPCNLAIVSGGGGGGEQPGIESETLTGEVKKEKVGYEGALSDSVGNFFFIVFF